MRIAKLEALVPHLPPMETWLTQTRVANPMSRYPEYAERRAAWSGPFGPVLVRLTTDDGLRGIGLGAGGVPACYIIEHHLRRFVIGQDPRDTERLWDQMFRASLPYGRKGLPIMAISAVDNALWDLKGKVAGQPVYQLLGGKTKPAIPVYATGNQPAVYASLGFVGNKLAMPYGPWDGPEGMRRNEELVAHAREALGPDKLLMLDCYMAWDVPYTLAMAERLRPYHVYWIEEALPPDDYEGYAELRRRITWTRITTGEHEYTRFGFHLLMQGGCADILQPDLAWCGGMTEAHHICLMAEARGLQVVPHVSGVPGYHLVMAHTNCPLSEFIFIRGDGSELAPVHPFFTGEPLPKNGKVSPPDAPGWGLDIAPEVRLERPFPVEG
jgi:L-rhamnonate dehydratase